MKIKPHFLFHTYWEKRYYIVNFPNSQHSYEFLVFVGHIERNADQMNTELCQYSFNHTYTVKPKARIKSRLTSSSILYHHSHVLSLVFTYFWQMISVVINIFICHIQLMSRHSHDNWYNDMIWNVAMTNAKHKSDIELPNDNVCFTITGIIKLAPSQWETSLQSYVVFHWLGASLITSFYQLCDTKS